MSLLFSEYQLPSPNGPLTLANRIVVAPMCQYSADQGKATDWVEDGWSPEETADLSFRLKTAGANFVHISSGGVAAQQKIAIGPEYQVPFAKSVKDKSGLPTIAVGLITQAQQAEAILQRGDANLIAIARAFLYNPRWAWQAAAELGGVVQASEQYWRCLPREAQKVFGNVKIGMR